jgi:hypothetical protein
MSLPHPPVLSDGTGVSNSIAFLNAGIARM